MNSGMKMSFALVVVLLTACTPLRFPLEYGVENVSSVESSTMSTTDGVTMNEYFK